MVPTLQLFVLTLRALSTALALSRIDDLTDAMRELNLGWQLHCGRIALLIVQRAPEFLLVLRSLPQMLSYIERKRLNKRRFREYQHQERGSPCNQGRYTA
jgi:hypothetical protein